jgi:hypothetical protein
MKRSNPLVGIDPEWTLDRSAYWVNRTNVYEVSSDAKRPGLTPPDSTPFPSLSVWPDDIIIHVLQFLEAETLFNFDLTCKRVHFFVRLNIKYLLESLIAAAPETAEIQHLIEARSYLRPPPPRHSFAYLCLLESIYTDFQTIAEKATPVQQCPRTVIHPEIDFSLFRDSHVNFFRQGYCHYFAKPIESIAHFWTIFWEFKRTKESDTVGFKEKVAKWAWERYGYRELLGVARFNACYYSRIITSSLHCQRDAFLMVLEIFRSKMETESWSFDDGMSCTNE